MAGVDLPVGARREPDPDFLAVDPVLAGPGVLWSTDEPVRWPGGIWSRLVEAFPRTGLWPGLLDTLRGDPGRPWKDVEFSPLDPADVERADLADVLRVLWRQGGVEGEPMPPPAGASQEVPPVDPSDYLDTVPEAYVGLVPTVRAADVPTVLGWTGSCNYGAALWQLSAMLRSWEERFGAFLVGLGFDTMTLLVRHPPVSPGHALAVAREHLAFCPDNVWQGAGDLATYAEEIEGESVWQFWWD